ncbi:hypothetical protein [Bathymodiolus platifrons methanotrophic gill symbiont]|uniref:hypothetical protein n=1 Tax=Bathymodiolus platifrons methanotrophic gill symbiont TaxID=113268 RepID=UPI001C8D011F
MGDALNALRPQRLRTKAASSLLLHWLDGYSECNSCLPRALLAHFGSANCPVAYQGLKIITPLRLRFPDFKRMKLHRFLHNFLNLFFCFACCNTTIKIR